MMALALGLVGQPVQPYLTTGATDYVNSVQKGKEDAIKTETLKNQSQKSALDLLTAQKKQKDEQWYSDNAGALSRKVKTFDVADEDLARMAQVNPEYHKVLQTERADAVKNFNASNLAYLGSSTDKAKSAQEIIQASEAHGMTIPDQFKQSPELLMQYLKVINAGSKAFDLKNVSKNESGDIITTDITGNTIDIKPAAVKAEKTSPVMVNGVPKTVKVPGTNEVKILNKDGTLSPGGSMPVTKADKTADHPVYFNTTLTGDAFLKTLSPVDQAHVKALNEGREPFPTAKMMASNPYYERLADAVAQYNPDFDATAFSTRKNANIAFTTGIQGRQLLAFGSAVKHLETLGGLIDALKNKDTIQLNRLNNLWEKQTGQTAVTNFEAAKGIIAKEIMKAIVTGGGGVEERQELSRLMDAAKSPEQLRGVVDTYYELMKVQKENLIIQRDAAGLSRSSLPDYTKHSADEGKTPTDNKGKQPQTPREWYEYHWYEAQKKGDKVRMQRLTEEARKMGIAK